MNSLEELVNRAREGDIEAFGELVRATHRMACAAALGVLRDPAQAQDAAQEAYLRAFKRIHELKDHSGFINWFRRIVITVAINMRRTSRHTLLRLDDVPEAPVLDEGESRWSDAQRRRLAGALLTLSREDRRLCDLRYHGQWSMARLAADAGVDEGTMRKRMQRIRDRLRKEIEVEEQHNIKPGDIRADFPAKVIELLAHPKLSDIPENPVGRIVEQLRRVYPELDERELPEIIDFEEARRVVGDHAVYVEPIELHRVDDRRILRYDLTLPLLLTTRYEGKPLRVWATGKAYRQCLEDAKHLEAFHQAEVFWLDERAKLNQWQMTARVLESVERVLPGRAVKIVPTDYRMCSSAWELEIEHDGQWLESIAWGVFSDEIVRRVGGDPTVHAAIGVGYGLERLAMIRYKIDDIRKIDVTTAA